MSYYKKLGECNFCKNLTCELSMVKDEVLGQLCVLCSKNLEGQLSHTGEQKEQMALEIATY